MIGLSRSRSGVRNSELASLKLGNPQLQSPLAGAAGAGDCPWSVDLWTCVESCCAWHGMVHGVAAG